MALPSTTTYCKRNWRWDSTMARICSPQSKSSLMTSWGRPKPGTAEPACGSAHPGRMQGAIGCSWGDQGKDMMNRPGSATISKPPVAPSSPVQYRTRGPDTKTKESSGTKLREEQIPCLSLDHYTVKLKAIEFHTIKRRNGEFNIFYV